MAMPASAHEQQTHDAGCASRAFAWLFRAGERDLALELDGVRLPERDDELLWIDLCGADATTRDRALASLSLSERMARNLDDAAADPSVRNDGDAFMLRLNCVVIGDDERFSSEVLTIVAGRCFVATLHQAPIGFLDELRAREEGETALGLLTPESFVASLLDWHLAAYAEAAAQGERSIDDLEQEILRGHRDGQFATLDLVRRRAARLRRLLGRHRAIFAAIARPDFRPEGSGEAGEHLLRVRENFERTREAVEDLRALVVGTFELMSTQIALRTNRTMQALTVITALFGFLAVVASSMGMNFEVGFFDAGAVGYWLTVAAMTAFLVGGLLFARRRGWL